MSRRVAQTRLDWRIAEVRETRPETSHTRSLFLDVPGWEGHRAGQHVDVRLTAPDGYQAQRSYSIASAPEDGYDGRLALLVERLDDGEVSPYLTDELREGDGLELRGPIGGWFAWEAAEGGPLLLVAGGSGIAPLAAMIRHRKAAGTPPQHCPPASSTPRAPARTPPSPTSSTGSPRTTRRWRSSTPLPASSPPAGPATTAASTPGCSARCRSHLTRNR